MSRNKLILVGASMAIGVVFAVFLWTRFGLDSGHAATLTREVKLQPRPRDYSTPSARLVGRWADPDPLIAATECEYFGPTDGRAKTGVFVMYRLESTNGTTSWKRFEHKYQIVSEDQGADKVTVNLLPAKGGSISQTHHIDRSGTSSSVEHSLANSVVTTESTYVDGKNLPCSESNERWNAQGLSDKSAEGLASRSRSLEQGKNLLKKWSLSGGSSSFDDSKRVTLTLLASNQITGWPGVTRTPALILRCQERKTEAFINVGMQGKIAFGGYGQDLGTSMRGRYDKGEVFHYLMTKSTDGQAFFFPKPGREIQTMMKHSSLVMEFTPFDSNPVEIRFDIADLTEAIKPLRDACSW
jgi:hypothetical protein